MALLGDILIGIPEQIDTEANTQSHLAVVAMVLERLLIVKLGLDGYRAVDEESILARWA